MSKYRNNYKKELLELSRMIISASANWTGEEEDKNSLLRTIRTLSGYYIDRNKGINFDGTKVK